MLQPHDYICKTLSGPGDSALQLVLINTPNISYYVVFISSSVITR